MRRHFPLLFLALILVFPSLADDGMRLFNHFPSATVTNTDLLLTRNGSITCAYPRSDSITVAPASFVSS